MINDRGDRSRVHDFACYQFKGIVAGHQIKLVCIYSKSNIFVTVFIVVASGMFEAGTVSPLGYSAVLF